MPFISYFVNQLSLNLWDKYVPTLVTIGHDSLPNTNNKIDYVKGKIWHTKIRNELIKNYHPCLAKSGLRVWGLKFFFFLKKRDLFL